MSKKTAAEKPKAEAKKPGKSKDNQSADILLLSWLGLIIAIWLCAGGLIGGIHLLSASSIEHSASQKQAETLGNTVAQLFQQRFAATQQLLNQLAAQDDVYNALALDDAEQQQFLANLLSNSIPQAESFRILPWSQLGTAGLKQRNIELRNNIEMMMLAKTDDGATPAAEVYQQDKTWLTSFVAPVKQEKNVIGMLLLTLKQDFLTGTLNDETLLKQGVFIINHEGDKKIFSKGSADQGAQFTTTLPFAGGKLISYTDTSLSGQIADGFIQVYILIGGCALVLTIFACIGYINGRKALHTDSETLRFYASSLAGLHETQQPKLRIKELVPVINVISQLGTKINRSAVNVADGEALPDIVVRETNREAAAPSIPQASEIVEGPGFDHPEIFRDYDIRGIADEQLADENAYLIGQAIGSEALSLNISTVVIGRDGRISSPRIMEHVAKGMLATGCNIITVGQVPTPVLYYAAMKLGTDAGIMITGSHNPSEYNGIKIMLGGAALQGERIQHLLKRIENGDFIQHDHHGKLSKHDISGEYIQEVCQDVITARPLKVVVDAGNGVGGAIAVKILQQLDCEVIPVNCEVYGNFPAHAPDPTIAAHLADLVRTVTSQNADLGIAFDGDADRVVAVTSSGTILNGDQLMMIFAQDIVSRNPGCNVVFDIKSSTQVGKLINQYGGRPIIWKSGHSNIKAKMQETSALLGGELTGHYFFKERWHGFDDGIYAGMRLIELLTTDDRTLNDRIAQLPKTISTEEITINLKNEGDKSRIMKTVKAALSREQGNMTDIDGIRIDYSHGWGLVRPSNTSTRLSLRFEADSEELLTRIQQTFKAALLSADDSLSIPF